MKVKIFKLVVLSCFFFVSSCLQEKTFLSKSDEPKSLNVNFKDLRILSERKGDLDLELTLPKSFDYLVQENQDGEIYRRYFSSELFKIPFEEGHPEILTRSFMVNVPNKASNIKINILDYDYYEINDVNLYPVPEKITMINEDGQEYINDSFYLNEEIYNQNAWLPSIDNINFEESTLRGLKVLNVNIPAMLYNPKLSSLRIFKKVKFSITYDSNNSVAYQVYSNDSFHKIFKETIFNYNYTLTPSANQKGRVEVIRGSDLINKRFGTNSNFSPDYLIISAKRFDSSNSNLINLINHRAFNKDSFNIAVAYTDDIYEYYREDYSEERIRSFVRMVYDYWRVDSDIPYLKYLLLVGDADYGLEDKDWFLPTWRSSESDDIKPRDLDYGFMSKDNQLVPELFIGRLPAQNEEELEILVNKITNFENNSPIGINHRGTRVLWVAGERNYNEWNIPPDGSYVRDLLISKSIEIDEYNQNYLINYFNSPFRLYQSDEIINYLSNKSSLIFMFDGHGSRNYPGMSMPFNQNSNYNNYNIMPALVYSISCQTAWFDKSAKINGEYLPSNSAAENWIKNPSGRAISFIGWTRNTYVSSPSFKGKLIDGIYDKNLNIVSEALLYSIIGMSSSDNDKRGHMVFLGDPAFSLENHLEPSSKPNFSINDISITPDEPSFYKQDMDIKFNFSAHNNLLNVPVKLSFNMISEGVYKKVFIGDDINITFIGNNTFDYTVSTEYPVFASLHFNPVLDPYNEIDELSEWDNQHKHYIKYYPVYVDSNATGLEHGTKKDPFKNIYSAINYLNSKFNDTIFNQKPKLVPELWQNKYMHEYINGSDLLKLYINEGEYGDGSSQYVFNKNIHLKGLSDFNKTIIKNGIVLNSYKNIVEDLVFDGDELNLNFSAITNNSKVDSMFLNNNVYTRNIFKNWQVYPVSLISNSNITPEVTFYNIFRNNIFYNNFGTILYNVEVDNYARLNLYNNTLYKNLNNINLNLLPLAAKNLFISLRSNIIKGNGLSSYTGSGINKRVRYLRHNNIDDTSLSSWAFPDPNLINPIIANFDLDPLFYSESDFRLLPESPCVDSGDMGVDSGEAFLWVDPDGTDNDRGAFGGPDSKVKNIEIKYPVKNSTIYFKKRNIDSNPNTPTRVPVKISWDSNSKSSFFGLNVRVTRIKEEGLEEVIVDQDTENLGYLETIIPQDTELENYKIHIGNNPFHQDFDDIGYFSISVRETVPVVHNNR